MQYINGLIEEIVIEQERSVLFLFMGYFYEYFLVLTKYFLYNTNNQYIRFNEG